ncbi:pilus assembly protein PilP [Vibrio renipiscarius]|uniref:Fimbrial protein n=1 Tax=Vibrio renipiscarius TaxID=1461322 RepID=A0A0C2JIB1_9VIBR|nr:pilus assembly protein PilP [Vibrio renipiscarius]KII77714.1 fimbrial protein [Vibrio renipiscarius]KII81538.1 fimbrial protein [Vibrio renipiscarius]
MKANHWRWGVVISVLLVGCRANQDPLDEFVLHAQQKAQKTVQELAPALVFRSAVYTGGPEREPFTLPTAALVLDQPEVRRDCWQPKPRKANGQLERYALNKLSLKGVMSRNGKNSALVQTPSGQVVSVRTGHYIGLNNGRVTEVSASYIQINETLPDGLGCWNKRSIKLALK